MIISRSPWICLLALATFAGFAAAADMRLSAFTEPGKFVKVSSLESGVLAELNVHLGDHVKKGQVLAKLDTRVVESERAIAQEEFSRLSLRYDKLAALAKSKDAAVEEVERAESELTIQKLRLKRIDAQIENFTIRSSIEGAVVELKIEVGESVLGANSHLLSVADVEQLHLKLHLPVKQARTFKAGQLVPLIFFDSQQSATGEVAFVSPLADPSSGTMLVELTLNNANGDLQSGVRCGLRDAENPTATKP